VYKSKEPLDPGEENMAEKFSGNALTCNNTLFFLALEAFLIFRLSRMSKADLQGNLIAMIAIAFFTYLYIGLQMFYFKVSSGHLIVKNHYLPWIKWHYKLEDLSKISITRYSRLSKSMFIFITGHHLYRIFPAGSLRSEDWAALKDRLEQVERVVKD
jgi:hypothetical protein